MSVLNIFKYLTFFTFVFVISRDFSVYAEEIPSSVVPPMAVQVEVENEGTSVPTWKNIWDAARQLVRHNQLNEAKRLYLILFEEKPNIIEAKWEYCKVLIVEEKWKESSQILEELLEHEPDNLEYLAAAGESALQNEHFSKAIRYFGQIYESDPAGPWYDVAIQGMAKGFTGTGNLKSAFLLLEQYYQRNGIQEEVLSTLAELSKSLDLQDKRRFYYEKLASNFPENETYLLQAALSFDSSGYYPQAAAYMEQYLQFQPDYLPFLERLAHYYLETGDTERALTYFIKVYKKDELASDLALKIADLYAIEMQQPDRALLYYEQYLNAFSEASVVQRKVKRIRREIARQYLPIVENDGEFYLWEDLGLITQKKEEIFLTMADLLEEQQKTEQEIRVLEILYANDTDNLDLAYRLAEACYRLEDFRRANTLLAILHENNYKNPKYLIRKAELEVLDNLINEALLSLQQYLRVVPNDVSVMKQAFSLAG
ncbi:MAG: hypothetical protein V2I36_13880, partial [Desulfopila sp.]|nr:hypothetical protein [Desulfopila sp.]